MTYSSFFCSSGVVLGCQPRTRERAGLRTGSCAQSPQRLLGRLVIARQGQRRVILAGWLPSRRPFFPAPVPAGSVPGKRCHTRPCYCRAGTRAAPRRPGPAFARCRPATLRHRTGPRGSSWATPSAWRTASSNSRQRLPFGRSAPGRARGRQAPPLAWTAALNWRSASFQFFFSGEHGADAAGARRDPGSVVPSASATAL